MERGTKIIHVCARSLISSSERARRRPFGRHLAPAPLPLPIASPRPCNPAGSSTLLLMRMAPHPTLYVRRPPYACPSHAHRTLCSCS